MGRLKDKNIIQDHRNSLAKTYLTLVFAFLLLAAINIFSYFTMKKMSNVMTKYKTALLQVQLDISKSYQLIKDFKTNSANSKDLNPLWKKIENSFDKVDMLSEMKSSPKIRKSIYNYKNRILDYVKSKNKHTNMEDKNWLKCEKTYQSFMQNISQTEGELKLFTDKKFQTLNILFMVSLFVILILFFFLIIAFHRYSRKRINAEQNLIYAKNSLDTVVNAIDSMLISCDKENKVSLWNEAVENFTNIESENAIGSDLFELLPMLKNYSALITKAYHSKHPQELYREKIEFDNGEQKIYDIKIHYTHGLDNVVIKIDDVTEHAMKDEQLRQSQKMGVVSNMINGLIHSFNNVLGAILGTVTMMKFSVKQKHVDWDIFQNNIEVIESSSEKAGLMLEQILSLTKNEPPKKEMLDLNNEIIHFMKICENTLDTSIEIDAELVDVKPIVYADKKQLELVLMGLCDNAAYSMTNLPPERLNEEMFLTVSIDHFIPTDEFREFQPLAKANSYWTVHIGDTGTGIPNEILKKIFEPFFSTKEKNTGLGLSVAEDIISQHNGFIEVRSELGTGTIFTFYLPEIKDIPKTTDLSMTKDKQENSAPKGEGTILIVDDDDTIRDTAAQILERLGYNTLRAVDGVNAIQLFREESQNIDLILLDISMPRFSGHQTYIELKKIKPDLKVLLFSGLTKENRIQEILDLGANGLIKKPFSFEEIAQKINETLNS